MRLDKVRKERFGNVEVVKGQVRIPVSGCGDGSVSDFVFGLLGKGKVQLGSISESDRTVSFVFYPNNGDDSVPAASVNTASPAPERERHLWALKLARVNLCNMSAVKLADDGETYVPIDPNDENARQKCAAIYHLIDLQKKL